MVTWPAEATTDMEEVDGLERRAESTGLGARGDREETEK